MELKTKHLPPQPKLRGPRIMATTRTGGKQWYRTYAFNDDAWNKLTDEEHRVGWVRLVIEEITYHMDRLGADRSQVRWEMMYPLDWSE